MGVAYATYSDFTAVYSIKGISQAEVSSVWTFYGSLRVNELLGKVFTTPFSSNNHTARDLSIGFGYLGVLLRTRSQEDSEELRTSLLFRVSEINSGNAPMILDDGSSVFATGNSNFDAYSTTQDFKSVFDMREIINQRVDPDLIDELWNEDIG